MAVADSGYEQNNRAYGRLKETIPRTYPHGWFIGIVNEQVVSAAVDFRALVSVLRSQGKDPRRALVVQASVDYPEYATIL